jgi:hypothetical protein
MAADKNRMDEVLGRSCYTPSWAGIDRNWYKNPAIDAVWKPSYDRLVEDLVQNHAPYIRKVPGKMRC